MAAKRQRASIIGREIQKILKTRKKTPKNSARTEPDKKGTLLVSQTAGEEYKKEEIPKLNEVIRLGRLTTLSVELRPENRAFGSSIPKTYLTRIEHKGINLIVEFLDSASDSEKKILIQTIQGKKIEIKDEKTEREIRKKIRDNFIEQYKNTRNTTTRKTNQKAFTGATTKRYHGGYTPFKYNEPMRTPWGAELIKLKVNLNVVGVKEIGKKEVQKPKKNLSGEREILVEHPQDLQKDKANQIHIQTNDGRIIHGRKSAKYKILILKRDIREFIEFIKNPDKQRKAFRAILLQSKDYTA